MAFRHPLWEVEGGERGVAKCVWDYDQGTLL